MLLIKCLRCRKDFYRNDLRTRNCGCAKYQKIEGDSKYWHDASRFFQDPIYQHFRLDNSENLSCEMRFVRPVQAIKSWSSIMVINKARRRKR